MEKNMFPQPPGPPVVEFKVVLLGDKGVGKTCLVLRFIEGTFTQKQQVSCATPD